MLIGVAKEGKDIETLQAVLREAKRARDFGFTATEYARAKADYLSGLEKLYTNRDKRKNEAYANEYVEIFLENEPIPSVETLYQTMTALAGQLPAELVNQYAQQIISVDEKNLVAFFMEQEKDGKTYITTDAMKKGTNADLLASLKPSADVTPTPADQILLAQQGQQQGTAVSAEHVTMDDNWLSKMGNMNDPMQMLAFMMGQNGGTNGMGMGFGGDLISTVVGMLFASAMALSARGSGVSSDVAATQSREKEEELSPEEERDAVIMRKRQTVDPERARQLASMNFDSECPEAGESQGVRLA